MKVKVSNLRGEGGGGVGNIVKCWFGDITQIPQNSTGYPWRLSLEMNVTDYGVRSRLEYYYIRHSRERPPRKFKKVVVTIAHKNELS